MTRVPDLRQLLIVAAAAVAVAAGAVAVSHRVGPSPRATSFVSQRLGAAAPKAAVTRTASAGSVQHVTRRGVRMSTHGQSAGLELAGGTTKTWTRFANGFERRLPFGRESIVLNRVSAEELVTVERRLGTRTWRWRLVSSLKPVLRADGSVALQPAAGGDARLQILPVAILDATGRNVTPRGLRWSLVHRGGTRWLQLRLADRRLPLPYVIDPSIALTGTCPNSAAQTDLSGQTTGSAVANGCSVATQSGTNGTTSLVMTAPTTVATGNVLVAQVIARSNVAIATPAGWTQIGTTQTNGTALEQNLYYRVSSGDTGGTTTWTWSVAAKADMSGGIIAFANVDSTSPVDVVSTTGTTGTGTTATAPAVTTTRVNDEILAFYASQQGVTLSTSTYGGAAATKYYSAASKANPIANEADSAGVGSATVQSTVGSTGTSTASLSASQGWIAQTVALNQAATTAVTFAGSRTKAGATATWTSGFTASATGSLTAGSTVTVTFDAAFAAGLPAAPAVTFGGSFSGCGATTGSTSSNVVTVTLPAGCSLANSAAGTVLIAGITNPAAATYTSTNFKVHTSADGPDTSPASSVVISAATPPTAVTFSGSRTKAGATATWTALFTASATGALSAGDKVIVTFNSAFGLPASPAVTFAGAGFTGCGAGATGSTSSNVVTVTLPSGCALANSGVGQVLIQGITNPTNATYTNTTFKVHTTSDTTDASPVTGVTISAATPVTAASFSGSSMVYGATASWTVGFTASASGSLAAGDTVVVAFDSAFAAGVPASPSVTFGGAFSGCAAGATGSTSSNVVTVTLPSGCTLANGAAGTLVVPGIVNPVPATYTNTSFKVHTSSDATDGSPASGVTTTKPNLTISGATASNKVYDGGTAATVDFSSAVLSGVVGSDAVTINSSAYTGTFASKTVGTGKAVTVGGVTLSGANAGYYTVSQPTGLTANITAKTLTVTGITAGNKVYDGGTTATLNTASAALSGVVAGDAVILGTAGATGTFATKTVGTGKTVTVAGLSISGADSGNYSLTQPTTTADITAKTLTVTGVTAGNKVYDGGTSATLSTASATLSGVVAGDTVTLGTGSATGSFAAKTVGTGVAVSVAGLSISGADSGNYTLTQPTATANITAKTLTVTGITAGNKVYDGGTSATLNTASAALAGVVGGDTVSLGTASATGTFATKTVGTGKTVAVAGLSISGADSGNYALTQPTTAADVTAKTLIVTGVTASNKTYDGTTGATLNTGSAALSGVVGADVVTLGGTATGTFADRNVGSGKPVTVAGFTIAGADSGNYAVTQPSPTANITAKALTVTGVGANDRVYDGTTAATLSIGSPALVGVVAGDTVNVGTAGATGSFADKAVGTNKAVAVTGVSISGADAGNYTVTQPSPAASITAKTLTVSGVTASGKTYDGTTAAMLNTGSAALVGKVAGDTVNLGTGGASGTFADKNVGANKTVTVAGLSISGADSGNYTLTQPTTTASVTAKALTVSGVTASDKTYDGTTAATLNTGSAALVGKVAGDAVNLATGSATGTFAGANVGTSKTVTVTGLSTSGTDAGNYTLTQPTTTANITAKNLTVTGAVANAKVYDGGTSATVAFGGASLVGVVSGDAVGLDSSSYAASFGTKTVGTAKAVTVTGVALSGAQAGNYTVTQPAGLTADITPRNLTVSGASAANKVYNGTTAATAAFGSASLVGVVGGDTVALDSSGYSATFATKTVGTAKPVTVSGIALSGADAANYTVSQPTGLTADITAKNLTVSGASANGKTYNGSTAAAVDFSGAALVGVVAGDTVTVDSSGYSASFASATAGTAKPVTVTGVALAGADSGNYAVSQPTGLTASITPKNLTVSGAVASAKTYDGTTAATVAFGGASLVGVVSGDTVSLDSSSYTASFATKDAGMAKAVAVSGVTLGGADAANYTVSQPTGVTADVTAKNLTVAGVVANDKVYDGTTAATLGLGGASLVGVVGGDFVTLDSSGASASFATATVGSAKAVTVAGLYLGGTDAGDYTVSQPTGLSASITKRNLTVAGAAANSRIYNGGTGATVSFGGASLVGVVGGDAVTIDSSGYSAAFASATVGTAKPVTLGGVALAGADAGNYTVSQPSGLTANITAKNLAIAGVVADNKVYDGGTAATVSFGGASLVGVVGSDAVTIDSSGYSATFASASAGSAKTVTVSGIVLGGADAGNYTISQPSGLTADITRKPLTVSGASANSKVYDGSVAATVDFSGASASGVVGGDAVSLDTSGYSASFAAKTAGTGLAVTVTGVATAGADAGNYTISQPAGLTANITKKPLTISGAAANNKIYDGTSGATVDFSGASLVGKVAGDAVTIDSSGYSATFAGATAGTAKPVSVIGVALGGADAADYTLSQPTGLSADITKKNLTISGAVANGKSYDGSAAATVNFTGAALVGVVGSDAVVIDSSGYSAAFQSAASGSSIPVTVTGVALGGADAGNYTVGQPSGLSADITGRALTLDGVVATDKTYNGNTTAALDFSGATLTGVVSGDVVTLDTGSYTATFATRNAGSGVAVTVTGLVLSGPDAAKYSLAQPTGLSAAITRKNLTIAGAVAQTKTYDGTSAATVDFGGASLVGVAGGDTVTIDSGGYTASFANAAAGVAKPVTVGGVALGGADAANYTVSQPSGLTADIAKKNLTISGAAANDRVYNGGTGATVDFSGASLSGKVAGDVVTVDSSSYTASFATRHAGTGKPVTVAGVSLAGADAGNYTVSQPTGLAAAVTARPLTVTAQPDTKQYDATTSSSVTPLITSGSLAPGDTAGFTQSFDSASVGTGKTLTASGAVNDGNGGNDYTVTFVGATGEITPAGATKLVFTAAPPTATGGAAFGTQPEVSVEDSAGNVVTTDNSTKVTLTIGTNPGGGALTCPTSTTTVTVSNGVASFAGCRIDRKGTGYTLTTSNDGGLADTTSAPFDVVAVATRLVVTSVNGGSNPTAGTGFSVTIEAQDAVGNAGDVGVDTAVGLSLAAGTGTLGGTLTGTIPAGQSSVTLTGVHYTRAEDITLSAAAPGLSASPASSTISVGPGPLAKLQILVPGESAAPGTATGKTGTPSQQSATTGFSVTVTAVDANWNRVATTHVVHVTSSDAAATLPGDTALAAGTTTLSVTLDTVGGGTQTVAVSDATDGSTAGATSAAVPVVAGAVSASASSTAAAPATVTADGTTTGTVTVTLRDGGGNAVAGKTVALAQGSGRHSTISPASGVSNAGGQVTFTVTDQTAELVDYTATDTTDTTAVTQTAQISFEDHNPPAAAIGAPAAAAKAAGTVTLTATGVSDGETGVAGVTFRYCDSTSAACDPASGTPLAGTDAGAGTWSAALDTTGLTTGHTYTWSAVAADNAGNTTATATRTLAVDNTPPAVAVAAPTALTGTADQYWDGPSSTLWLRATGSGSFALDLGADDAQTGVAKVTFPAMLGTPAHDATTTTGGATNYRSNAYGFDHQASDIAPVTMTATNTVTAGNGATAASAALSLKVDGAGPSATLAASLDGKTVSSGVLVGATSTDAGSGVEDVGFVFCDRTADALCAPSTPLGTATSAVAGVYSVTWTTSGLVDGHQYAVAAVATDNVGNQTTSAISTVTVDDSAPSVAYTAPVTAGDTYWKSAASTLFVKAAGSGSFTLEAHATDAQSSISAVTFPAVLGTSANAGSTSGGGDYDSTSYSFDGTSTPVSSATATVTAANGVELPAALTSTDQIAITADASTPTTATQFPVSSGGYDPNSWPAGAASCTGTQPEGLCGTVNDTGSGVAVVKLSLQDLGGGKYFDGTSFAQATQAPLQTANVTGGTWSYPLNHTKLTTGSYELTVYALDNVGNVEVAHTIDFDYGTDLSPPDTTLTLTGTHAFLAAAGSHAAPNAGNDYVLYYSTAGSGGFTLHASSTDESGIDHIAFPGVFGTSGVTRTNSSNANPWSTDSPSYSFGAADTTPPLQALVTSVDTRGTSGDDTLSFLVDDDAPAGGSVTTSPVDANGYATTTSLTLAHTAYTDGATGSGMSGVTQFTVASAALSDGACGTFGSDSPVTDGSFTAADGRCYRFTATGTDNVGNVSSATKTVKVDTTAPSTPSVVFSGLSTGNTYDAGAGTLWYRPSPGGAFTVDATSTDAESGLKPANAGYAFSSLLGGTQTAGSLAVTFGPAGIGSGSYTVHASNRAGLDSGDAGFTVDADSTPPVAGALKVNGTDAAGTATSSYRTADTTIAIDNVTPYTDAGSGIAGSTLTMESATLASDTCGTFGGTTTIAGGTTSVSVTDARCYRFTLTGIDHVGNSASLATIVKVDTTPPSTPAIVFTGLSTGNTYAGGTTLFYRPSAGGTFSVAANGATDPETGVAGYTFSPLNGFASTTQSGNRLDVTFDGSSAGGGSYSIVATSHASVDSSPAPFTVTADGTDPAGGLLSVNPYSSSTTVAVGEADFTDGQSGIASNVLTRSDPKAPSGGVCPATGYTGATPVAVSGGAASDTVPTDGACYEYTLTGTDRVGNVATFRTLVLVDTTPATGGTVEAPDGLTSLAKISVDWNAGTDAESGILRVDVERAESALSGSTCDPLGSFTPLVANASTSPIVDAGVSAGHCYRYRIVVTNRAGVSATFTSSSITELTNASPIAISGSPAGTSLSGSTLWLGPSATSFALQLTGVGANGVASADWSASSGSLNGAAVTATTGSFASGSYAWDGTAPLSASITVTRRPTGTVDTLTVASDTTQPAGTVQYADGVNASHSVHVGTSGVSDGESGVDSVEIRRAETTLTGSTCGSTWSAYQPVTLTGGNDTTVQDERCYRYELVVTDNVGNVHTDASSNVVEIPDVTPPTFSSAVTDASGAHLTITMSEPLDGSSVPAAGRFVVAFDGAAQPTPGAVHVVGSTIVLDLATPPNNSQTVTVRYSSDGSLRDDAAPTANATASFGPAAVTNGTTDTTAPMLSSAAVDGETVTLRFDEALDGNAPPADAFVVTVHGVARAVSAVSIDGKVATLTLASAVGAGDTVTVHYGTPALDALHDASANTVAPFTSPVTNLTQPVSAPAATPPTTTTTVPLVIAPALLSAEPGDGVTVPSASSFSLTANQSVAWTNMTLARPDGVVAPLADASGTTASWPLGTAPAGLYVVRGTIAAAGRSETVLTHFTIWTPGTGTAQDPATATVEKNAGGRADSLATTDAGIVASWQPSTFGGEPVVVHIAPQTPAAVALPAGSLVVDVTAFLRDSHTPVTQLGDVLDIQFRHAPPDATPRMSQDAHTWSPISELPTLQLPAAQREGWFRDSDGTVHVLTRHLTYYALSMPQAATKLALRITTPRRLWLEGRSFMAVRIVVTAPARVTGNFVAADGTVIPGQVIRTPTRQAGATILRVPLHVTKPGLYRLQVHAEGLGQVADRTARIRFLAHKPASPLWQSAGPLQVAVIRGVTIGHRALAAALGPKYVVRTVGDADLYSAVDPRDEHAAAAVVADLRTVPLASLASLHLLLPELRIIGLTSSPVTAAAARALGIQAVRVKHSGAPVTRMIESLIPVRR